MNMLKRFKNARSSGESRSSVPQRKVIDVDVVDIHQENDPTINSDAEGISSSAPALPNNSLNTVDNNFNEISMAEDNSEEASITEIPSKDYPSTRNLVQSEKSNEDSSNACIEGAEKESKKCRRKRWSKNVNVLHLPGTISIKNTSSSVEVSTGGGAWTNNEKGSGLKNRKQIKTENIAEIEKSGSTYENIELNSERKKGRMKDDVLTIETDPARKETLIKLTSDCDSNDTSNTYTAFPEYQKGIDNAIVTVEKFAEPVDDTNNFVKQLEDSSSQQSFEEIRNLPKSRNSLDETQRKSTSSDSPVRSDTENENLKSTGKRKRETSLFRHRDSSEDDSNSSEISEKEKRKSNKRKAKSKIQNPTNDYENIEIWHISVMIHGTQAMESDLVTRHPMVKVYVVESSSGNYLKIPETLRNGSGYLQPLVTGTFDFKENRSMIPQWNEELIFEYDFKDLLNRDKDRFLLLFEVVDLLNFAEASSTYDQYGSDGCWRRIAWAFMRPFGTNGVSRMNKKIRLQLYKPMKRSKRYTRHHCEVWTWWKSNIREKYSGTIVMTVSTVKPQNPIICNNLTLNELWSEENHRASNLNATIKDVILPKWSRLAAQSCKIPNELMFETEVSENGCSYVAFSNDGKYLACANLEEYEYPIVVYEVDQGIIHIQFVGHNGFVYSLDWSCNDDYLLSISSDHTARMWDVRNKIVEHAQMLPHPAYVYCGKFDPSNPSVVATGGQDHVVRIWVRPQPDKDYELLQELEGHEGFVNSMCFQKDGDLLTADSTGVIIQWTRAHNRRKSLEMSWQIKRTIKNREFEGSIINTIILHPLGSRLLVHTRDNGLRMLDLATGVILQRFEGLKNLRVQTASCISPCGALVLSGGEDSTLNIWDLESGRRLAKYEMRSGTISCVDYHPYDHVLTYSNYRGPGTTKILRYAKNATGESVNLNLIAKDDSVSASSANSFANLVERSAQLRDEAVANPGPLSDRKPMQQMARKRSSEKNNNHSIPCSSGDSIYRYTEEDEHKRHRNAKSKSSMAKESDRKFKEKSSNRLTNIIEKIDMMLSTTSAYTPERNHSTDQCYDIYGERVQSPPHTEANVSGCYIETVDRLRRISIDNEPDNSTGSSKNRISQTVDHRKIKQTKTIRSRSVQCRKNPRDDEIALKTLSDSAKNSESLWRHEKIRQGIAGIFNDPEDDRNFRTESKLHDFDTSEFVAAVPDSKDNDSATDSGGTYIIEK